MPLSLDIAGCLASRVRDHGLTDGALDDARPLIAATAADLDRTRGTGPERWRLLPVDPLRCQHTDAVHALVETRRNEIENLLVLGIGGSALGAIAVHAALNGATWNMRPRTARRGPRLFVLDNVDPVHLGDILDEIRRDDPRFERTLVNVVSKSGETAETAAQFITVRALLRDALGERASSRIVATTDPESGTLRSLAASEGYATLPVPQGVGGRFSVLSPVGLFPLAMVGIDIDALLDGAAAMDEICRGPEIPDNPAATLAWVLIELGRAGKTNHVLIPYSTRLAALGDWYAQLWAESLGKREDLDGNEVFAGFTPIRAVGATDQHSQVQLYREGPKDKVIGFVTIEAHGDRDVEIPAGLDVEPLRYLQGRSFGELLAAEQRATEYALAESGRPSYRIALPKLDAYCIGAFLQLWMVATSFAGRLLNVNAYDQPAVETGKLATFGLMGRAGYEEWKTKVDAALGAEKSGSTM
ncbi:MAG: glucose-6-phosphate isomerase [Planctomycetota bacterium]|jgi:glucose-6-phosphate isomerase